MPRFKPRSDLAFFLGAVIAVLFVYDFMIAPGSTGGDLVYARVPDYYGHLTDAFLAGHTYVRQQPDPALLTLKDPFLDAPWVLRMHDASYFNGRYYLYWGAGPAVFLLVPWHVLTGTYLSERAATIIFVHASFLLGAALIWRAWRRLPAPPSRRWLAGGIVLWGLGNHAAIIMTQPTVYTVPITFAQLCIVGALLGLWRGLEARTPSGALAAMTASAACWGLALAGRPNYLFGLAALLWPAWHLVRTHRVPRFAPRLVAAVASPLLLIGGALATYNWVRFHDITEFGVHLQFTPWDQRHFKLFNPANVVANVHAYLLNFPELSTYFPFTTSMEGGYGLLCCLPFAAIAAAYPLTLRRKADAADAAWKFGGGALLAAFLLNLIATSGFPVVADRYGGDFVPLVTLLAVLTAFRLLAGSTEPIGRRVAIHGGILLLAGWTLACAALLILTRHPLHAGLASLEAPALRIAHAVERMRGIELGPLRLRAEFPAAPPGSRLPVVTSGHGRDILFVEYLAPRQMRFGFFHMGNAPTLGETFLLDDRPSHELGVDLGSLYPPPLHPVMRPFSAAECEVMARTVTVELDGREVLHASSNFYPTDPDDLRIGQNPQAVYTLPNFGGKLTQAGPRVMPKPGAVATQRPDGPLRITLTLPDYIRFHNEPIVSMGHQGQGDVFFVSYVGPGRVRFGHDSRGGGAVETEIVTYDPASQHELELDAGALHPKQAVHGGTAPLVIRFDGVDLYEGMRPYNPTAASEIVFGLNAARSSVVSDSFGGRIVRVAGPVSLPAPPPVGEGSGPLQLAVHLPQNPAARAEPLLTTGHAGAGDVVFLVYVDPSHLRVGVDHWGVGGPITAPVVVNYGKTQRFEIALASLYPPEGDPRWQNTPPAEQRRARTRVVVKLDEQIVLDEPLTSHPSLPAEISVGANPIGASSCAEKFSGEIVAARRANASTR